jgi:hypothetical protein
MVEFGMRIYGVRTASVARPPGTIEITDRGIIFHRQVFGCEFGFRRD